MCVINDILRIVSQKCSETLKHVTIVDNAITEIDLKCLLVNCKKLEVLQMDKNEGVTGECFNLLGDQIKLLSIIGCKSIKTSGINALIEGNGKNLVHLKLGDSITPEMLNTICSNIPNLKRLELQGFPIDHPIV